MTYERCLTWLEQRGFVPVEEAETGPQLRVLGRVAPERRAAWLEAAGKLLEAAEHGAFKVDVSEALLRREGKLVRAWRVVLQADDFDRVVDLFPVCEVAEFALPGGAERNSTIGGRRGAGPTGTVLVGPAALENRRLGG